MIVDLRRFLAEEEPYWTELGSLLDTLETDLGYELDLDQTERFLYLYQRASAGLAKLAVRPFQPEVRHRLEALVARAYAEIHETRKIPHRFSPVRWFFHTFPQTFRRQRWAFFCTVIITLVGSVFGGLAVYGDPEAKSALLPFGHGEMDPADRVKEEESQNVDRLEGRKGSFAAFLMTHNTQVACLTFALGISWGFGTILLLFYNGVVLGAITCDYLLAGQARFLAGWLLPHGVIEIPAILIAGQAGLVLGKALIGWRSPLSVKTRLRRMSTDLITLVFGVAVLLVWAGLVEAFLSQYHEPVIPYSLKIAFGLVELVLLCLFLARSGRDATSEATPHA